MPVSRAACAGEQRDTLEGKDRENRICLGKLRETAETQVGMN